MQMTMDILLVYRTILFHPPSQDAPAFLLRQGFGRHVRLGMNARKLMELWLRRVPHNSFRDPFRCHTCVPKRFLDIFSKHFGVQARLSKPWCFTGCHKEPRNSHVHSSTGRQKWETEGKLWFLKRFAGNWVFNPGKKWLSLQKRGRSLYCLRWCRAYRKLLQDITEGTSRYWAFEIKARVIGL